jgi:uncharacterized protein YbaR (Trm112 family)
MFNIKLLDILVCSECKAELIYKKQEQELICHKCKLAYPIDEGIPVMLVNEARELKENE